MAVCLFVSNPFKSTRFQLSNIDLKNTVADLKNEIKESIGIKTDKQELIYLGDCLEEEDRSLQSYGVENDVTIFVFEKIDTEEKEEEDLTVTLDELEGILKKARNPLYRQSVKKFIKNREALKKVVRNITISKVDPVTSALIQDPDLFLSVIDTCVAEDIVDRYPALCFILKSIISSVSIDPAAQLFQDDEEEELVGIDPAFLAQAELFAVNEEEVQQQASSSQQNTQSSQQSRHQISASDLANALSIASMSPTSTATPSSSNTDNEEEIAAALEQMKMMGITDENLSRRALRMSGGDVEIALNLIFEGTLA